MTLLAGRIPPDIPVRTVRRSTPAMHRLAADICVVGSGAAGLSAAIEAARAGSRVVLVGSSSALGGQAVNSVIGTFCGLFSNGPEIVRLTHGISVEMIETLLQSDDTRFRPARNSIIVQYDETALARWIDRTVSAAGIRVLLGATLRGAHRDGRRITTLDLATRYGDVSVEAEGFVDASGDAAVAWHAGLAVNEPESQIFGSQIVLFENFDEAAATAIDRWEMQQRLAACADAYGLVRRDGFVFAFPGHGTALANMTHVATPLDPLSLADTIFSGRDQADRLLAFLRAEYPHAFGSARIRAYPALGVRRTRWISGARPLSADNVRQGTRFDDAVTHCSWPIELHHRADDVYWEELGDGHVHQVPLGAMLHR